MELLTSTKTNLCSFYCTAVLPPGNDPPHEHVGLFLWPLKTCPCGIACTGTDSWDVYLLKSAQQASKLCHRNCSNGPGTMLRCLLLLKFLWKIKSRGIAWRKSPDLISSTEKGILTHLSSQRRVLRWSPTYKCNS